MKVAAGTTMAGATYGAFTTMTPTSNNFVACDSGMQIGGVDVSKYLQNMKTPEWVNKETVQPLAGGLTFGGASGLAAGIACKKIGKAVAVGVGGLYCMFQVAASYGYITVNWKKVESDVMKAMDTNGDVKIDEKDMGIWLTKALQVLSNEE